MKTKEEMEMLRADAIAGDANTRVKMIVNNHDVILAIINDVIRMQQNLYFMDDTVKGVSQLKNRIKSIIATLNSNQYEIPDLIGHSYHEGDNMIGTLELNPELPPATNRIKRVIKPQVSYQGKLIQAAEVIIEYNE